MHLYLRLMHLYLRLEQTAYRFIQIRLGEPLMVQQDVAGFSNKRMDQLLSKIKALRLHTITTDRGSFSTKSGPLSRPGFGFSQHLCLHRLPIARTSYLVEVTTRRTLGNRPGHRHSILYFRNFFPVFHS
ncbi:unnamed protein product [Brassica oleracea]